MAANAFAASMLMPREDFKKTAQIFLDRVADIPTMRPYMPYHGGVYGLMRYFAATYMAAVIRCFELRIFDESDDGLVEYLLDNNDYQMQEDVFERLPQETHIMKPSYEDDFEKKLYRKAATMGKIQEIEGLVASIDDIVIMDESEICCYLFRTNHLVFLDTCFVTHQSGYQRQTQVCEALGHLCGGVDIKDVVSIG